MKRKLLAMTLVAAMAVATLTACGGSNSAKSSGETITVLNYGKYYDEDALKKFEEETGITVKYEEYESPEEMYTKYKSGSIDYDVICTSDYMIEKLIGEGEVNEIDYSALANYDNVESSIIDLSASFDPDHKYTIPYFYGTVGILYNTSKVSSSEVKSWNVLWDEKYKDEIIQENSVRDAFVPALAKLGYSINTTNETELNTALDLLEKQSPLVYAYMVDETGDEMINENASLAVVYSGEAAYAMDFNEDLAYIVPDEGSNLWIDSWFMPKTCKNKEAAQKFLDYTCSDEAAEANFEYVYYASPIKSVIENQDEDVKSNEAINPSPETLKRCEVYRALDDTTTTLYSNLWKDLKSK